MHARGLQFILHDKDTNEDDFDSCMRKDCNVALFRDITGQSILIHACARIVTRQRVGTAHNGSHFDSCMREDCNAVIRSSAIR